MRHSSQPSWTASAAFLSQRTRRWMSLSPIPATDALVELVELYENCEGAGVDVNPSGMDDDRDDDDARPPAQPVEHPLRHLNQPGMRLQLSQPSCVHCRFLSVSRHSWSKIASQEKQVFVSTLSLSVWNKTQPVAYSEASITRKTFSETPTCSRMTQ